MPAVDREEGLHMYEQMFKTRTFEEHVNKLYTSAKMPGLAHLYIGEEAVAVGVCEALRRDDYITSTHRGHSHCLAKGASVDKMFCELLGKEAGYCRGKGGSMHIADQDTGNLGANAIVGGSAAIATGAAFASKRLTNLKVPMVLRTTMGAGRRSVTQHSQSLHAWLSDARGRAAEKITYTDLLVKLTAAALRQHPCLNASWHKDTILLNPEVNIGLAVAIEDGLVVPVVHHADTLGLGKLAARRIELVAKAQAGKLTPNDISGGTFTISDLGMYLVDAFNAIVNPPQAAILAISRIADRVVPVNGQPAVQPMMNLSLSCDHRVVDGARGAQFLQTFADLIQDPLRLWD